MNGKDKSHHSWKYKKNDFKYRYIHKQDNIDKVFEDFVKQQENNPRYIIFKGITTTLFESSKKATNKKDMFKYGFIDTKSGIKLGDYIIWILSTHYYYFI